MTLREINKILQNAETIAFQLPDGKFVPSHFHVTEVGKITKDFIDCGGVLRHEEVINFQLWDSDDYNHRLHPEKLVNIIELSQNKLGFGDLPIEVEYQGETIGKYGIDWDGKNFLLTTKQTDCLAKDKCVVPTEKKMISLSTLTSNGGCDPESGCC